MTRYRRSALLVLLVLVVAACGGGEPSGGISSSPAGPAVTSDASPDTGEPSPVETDPPAETEAPAGTETPVDTESPVETTEPAESTGATAPAGSGGADACTGNDDNRAFLEGFAEQVDWTVLCAVLPRRWSVDQGSYRLANGGRLLMSYNGPGGATLALSEGAFCREAGGCVPPGTDAGEAAMGPKTGTLVELDDGGWVIVVDRGAELSWQLETQGLDEDATRSLGAALAVVEG